MLPVMKWKMPVVALLSFFLGVVVSWIILGRMSTATFGHLYCLQVADQANVALHIRAGKQDDLLKVIDEGLPIFVKALNDNFRSQPGATNALWLVRGYYENNLLPMPAEITNALAGLPPRPPTSCEIKLRELRPPATTNSPATTTPK